MSNSLCNILIGVSSLGVAALAFSKEIAKGTKKNWIDKLPFKVLILICFVGLGIWATREKDIDSEKQVDVQKTKIDSIRKTLDEIHGDGFPIVQGYIVNHIENVLQQQEIVLRLVNKHKSPIYDLTVDILDPFDLYNEIKKNPGLMSFSIDPKSRPISSLAPDNNYLIYDKKLELIKEKNLEYNLTISWRNDFYRCKVAFDIDYKLSTISPTIEYEYKNKVYSSNEFETKYCVVKH